MRRIILLLLLTGIGRTAFSNAAQPGFWSASGFSEFVPLVRADSQAVGKIRMQSEFVAIHVYRGFAVVKGTYRMRNLHGETVTFTAGYPLWNRKNELGSYLLNTRPDSLARFRVLVNGQLQPHSLLADSGDYAHEQQKWYAWKNTFGPMEEKVFTVYFMVEIPESSMRKGYDRYKTRPFIYITESGSTWQHPIERADILVVLKDGLELKHVEGIWPLRDIRTRDRDRLLYSFRNKTPSDTDNLVLAFSRDAGPADGFSIAQAWSKADSYYAGMDAEKAPESLNGWEPARMKDFRQLENTFSGNWIWMLIIIIPALLLVALIVLVVWVVRRIRRRKG